VPSPILNFMRCEKGSLVLAVLNLAALVKATARPTGEPVGDTGAPRIVSE